MNKQTKTLLMVGGGAVLAYLIFKAYQKSKPVGFVNAKGSELVPSNTIFENIKENKNFTIVNTNNVKVGEVSKSNWEKGKVEGLQLVKLRTSGIPVGTNVGGIREVVQTNACYLGYLQDTNQPFTNAGVFYIKGTSPQNSNIIKKVSVGSVNKC
jgi:hypothetical protein